MQLTNLKAKDILSMDKVRVEELEVEIRRKLVLSKIDMTSASREWAPKRRELKKSLARIMTVKNQLT
mgnify:CR=1 FL=1